ncbi:MAG TPA: MFS transporter [Planctomycetota bacterium]|nr:MFS transporter [Planctomycetota bacterium]
MRSRSLLLPAGSRPLKRGALGVLFLTVFIDLLGFGIVLPLLPRYGEDFHASGGQIGLLFAAFSGMQFLFAPLWGRLSDRFGRRPMILLGLCGSAASYLLFGLAQSYLVLLLSRALAGVFAATIGTAQAYIADVTGSGERGRGMALIGAAFGIGFTFGPVLGWVTHDFLGPMWPGFSAALLSTGALVLAWRKLPEPERHRTHERTRRFAGFGHVVQRRPVLLVVCLQFVATFAFASFEGTLALLTDRKYQMQFRGNGLLFMYIGACLLVAQGFLVRRLMPRVGERRFSRIGAVCLGVGLLAIPLSGATIGSALPVFAVTVFGFAMLTPSLASLLSLHTPDGMQGEVLGVGQSATSLARILGPWVGNVLFARHIDSPYFMAAAVMALAAAATLLLPGRPSDPVGEAAAAP